MNKTFLLFLIVFYTILNANSNELENECHNGSGISCLKIGLMYDKKFNYDKAKEFYILACNNNLAIACTNVGDMIDKGQGGKANPEESIKYFNKACEEGDPKGCFNLANRFLIGKYVKVNTQKAIELYKKSCKGGYYIGCYNLGVLYFNGKIVEKNCYTSIRYLEEACNNGVGDACHNIAVNLFNGECIKKDIQKSLLYYKKACINGSKLGCNSIAEVKNIIELTKGENCKKATKKYTKVGHLLRDVADFCMERIQNKIICQGFKYKWMNIKYRPYPEASSKPNEVDSIKLFNRGYSFNGSETVLSGDLIKVNINGTWIRKKYICGGDHKTQQLTRLSIY